MGWASEGKEEIIWRCTIKMRREKTDYAAISARHKEIVRRVCDPKAGQAEWDTFIAEIKPYVTSHFADRLKNEIGLRIEDFIKGDLMEYFAADKCGKFRQFLNLQGPAHHFGSPWFTSHLRAAVDRTIEKSRNKIETVSLENIDDEGQIRSGLEQIKQSERLVGVESGDPDEMIAHEIATGGGMAFTLLLSHMWKKWPLECYAVIMDWWLKFDHWKIAKLFGYDSQIPVGGNIRNFKRKLLKSGLPDVSTIEEKDQREIYGLFQASGIDDKKTFSDLASSRSMIEFRGADKKTTHSFSLNVRFPFIVEKDSLIRCSVRDGAGNVPLGTLVFGGKERTVRDSGDFEIEVDEFKDSVEEHEVRFTWADGVSVAALPVVTGEEERYALTGELLRKWMRRKVTDENRTTLAAEMLNDFGPGLAFLLMNERGFGADIFKRFGFPDVSRRMLRRTANEAWILFKGDFDTLDDSAIDPNGFLLPVEWEKTYHDNTTEYGRVPKNLASLADDVCAAMGVEGWRLVPSRQFFAERVNLDSEEVFGNNLSSVSSAAGSLSVALEYAVKRFAYTGWPYSSIAWDFRTETLVPVGGLREKSTVAESYGARRLYVSSGQNDDIIGSQMKVIEVEKRTLSEISKEIAYDHLKALRPQEPLEFRVPGDEEYLEKRSKLVARIRAKANPDKVTSVPRFVTVFGKPGMGKSVLAGLLAADMKKWGWCVLPYVCRAGKERQGFEFVKSLAYAVATAFGELHDLGADPMGEFASDDVNGLVDAFRRLVVEPVKKVSALYRGRKFVVLVDGLDEDRSGAILDILSTVQKTLPKGVSVVVTSRRIPQDEVRLTAMSSDVIDLNGDDKDVNEGCYTDLRAYIDLWLLRDGRVRKAMLDAKIEYEDAKAAICEKDPSFVYAYHVLNGVAEGRYSFDRLKEQLPADLCAAFYDAFKARFPEAEDYLSVRMALSELCRCGRMSLADLEQRVCCEGENIGKTIRDLRGYVTVEGGHVELSGEPLREWLTDSVNNPEFAVGKISMKCHIDVG